MKNLIILSSYEYDRINLTLDDIRNLLETLESSETKSEIMRKLNEIHFCLHEEGGL